MLNVDSFKDKSSPKKSDKQADNPILAKLTQGLGNQISAQKGGSTHSFIKKDTTVLKETKNMFIEMAKSQKQK